MMEIGLKVVNALGGETVRTLALDDDELGLEFEAGGRRLLLSITEVEVPRVTTWDFPVAKTAEELPGRVQ